MMGFNPTFYAGRPKLSEVTIDSDLDMGGRDILRARIGSPYTPETWPTEEVSWGDIAPKMRVYEVEAVYKPPYETYTKVAEFTTPDTPGNHVWVFDFLTNIISGETLDVITQKATSDVIHTQTIAAGNRHTIWYVDIEPNTDVEIVMYPPTDGGFRDVLVGTFVESHMASWPKTFDLSGKWLALGLDMQGLTATVKIQGVEMPYSDYVKYFPLAPSELTISGVWDASQTRPDVEVYL